MLSDWQPWSKPVKGQPIHRKKMCRDSRSQAQDISRHGNGQNLPHHNLWRWTSSHIQPHPATSSHMQLHPATSSHIQPLDTSRYHRLHMTSPAVEATHATGRDPVLIKRARSATFWALLRSQLAEAQDPNSSNRYLRSAAARKRGWIHQTAGDLWGSTPWWTNITMGNGHL